MVSVGKHENENVFDCRRLFGWRDLSRVHGDRYGAGGRDGNSGSPLVNRDELRAKAV
jgi:hypothetical protein